MAIFYLVLAVLFNVAAYAAFRSIAHRAHDAVWAAVFAVGLLLGAANVGLFTVSLRDLKLSIAYPAFAGASIALIVILSAVVYSEALKPIHLVGGLLIVAGIAALSR